MYIPAPVVPPVLFEDKMVGDWRMVSSSPPTVSSTVFDRGSTKPRLLEGIGCENWIKASKTVR